MTRDRLGIVFWTVVDWIIRGSAYAFIGIIAATLVLSGLYACGAIWVAVWKEVFA